MPRCPVCEGSLNGVKRYAKIVKKAALDAYFVCYLSLIFTTVLLDERKRLQRCVLNSLCFIGM